MAATVCFPALTRAQTAPDFQETAKTRAAVQKLGVGRDARVEVKLRDKTKLKGYISAAEQDSFTLIDSKTGSTQTVSYVEVDQVKRHRGGISTRSWIIIGAVATAAIIIGATVIKPVVCDGGAQSRGLC
jgi:hypothetical protein